MVAYHTFEAENFPKISYRKTGNGDPLILIHGFPENGTLWQQVWPELSQRFMVIAPDLPGSGETVYNGGELSVEVMALTVQKIMEREGIEEAVIAGHSMGGYAALAFVDFFPEMTKGLSLVHSSAYADTEEKRETRRKAIGIIRKGGKDVFVRQMVTNLFSAYFKENQTAAINRQIETSLVLPEDSLVDFYNAMINRQGRVEVLRSAAFPVQWIIGREDNATPMAQALQQCYLANVNFVSVYADCGHMSMIEQPAKLVSDLGSFTAYCFK
ncbi:alpha/beta fold hydrolase [Taibaiella soli]|uniref:AB hydrolase-1 domain-containing protein n=1 Tax=Taibaiella soli TaxID=1649169 RepID=A0A2W2AFV1_9BACT|nr:alpha/beta hydrolase [Taibaiella soli]PZF74181.1 hypothetical protein DN068_03965 [Taibaiella soli]